MTLTKPKRKVTYKAVLEEIKNDPKGTHYLCCMLNIKFGCKMPELELFRPDVETEQMEDSGWFGYGGDDPNSNATRVFVLAMMIEML